MKDHNLILYQIHLRNRLVRSLRSQNNHFKFYLNDFFWIFINFVCYCYAWGILLNLRLIMILDQVSGTFHSVIVCSRTVFFVIFCMNWNYHPQHSKDDVCFQIFLFISDLNWVHVSSFEADFDLFSKNLNRLSHCWRKIF